MQQYEQLVKTATEALKANNAILLTGSDPVNIMTIGWCQWGSVWHKDICTIFVRPSRYSHGLLEESGRFTVSVPLSEEYQSVITYCGRTSGRDADKLKELALETVPSRTGGVPALKGKYVNFECKVLLKTVFGDEEVAGMPEECQKFYRSGDGYADLHHIYFAEVLDAWQGE